ncbi:threonine ammonia-lyase, biosynthetic [Gammaproteobacteria bacterium]|nr:threonine ammonia-lyase, biosynthetic [Gammaproteobacteria bacterium]
MTITDYLRKILTARVYEVARETPLQLAEKLSARLDNEILIKREDLQPIHTYKCRGAYNKLSGLSHEDRARGVVCASAGNHAQGVALGAKKLGISAIVVMPVTAPAIKVDAVRALGAEVVQHGDNFDACGGFARELAEKEKRVWIPPYDDPEVIAGQGTVAVEILRQASELPDAIFVPIGGGGLIAGVAAYVKSVAPEIKIIGVEPVDAASMAASVEAGERIVLAEVGQFADGVAVKMPGEHTFAIAREYVDEFVTATNDEMCAAIKDVFEESRAVLEPSGALALAGLKNYIAEHGLSGQRLVAIASGANVNFDRLRYIAERAEVGEDREGILAVSIPERRRAFLDFCELIGDRRQITEFNYRFSNQQKAHIFVGLQVQGPGEIAALVEQLHEADYPVLDLTHDEFAKLHLRHTVGGRAPAANEVLYRFEFPERAGALLRFLKFIGSEWNISLFHYRNHGADYGRVLAGIQVPSDDREAFRQHLDDLAYPYTEETDNPAYRLFLGSQHDD